MAKTLMPVRDKTYFFDLIEKILVDYFKDEIYLPLIKILDVETDSIKNSKDYLSEAIKSGRVTFYRGRFSGKFNARVSKQLRDLGAVWDKQKKNFKLHSVNLPQAIQRSIENFELKSKLSIAMLDEKLEKIIPANIADKLNLNKVFSKAIEETHESMKDSLKSISVQPILKKEDLKKISDEYTHDMSRYIGDWAKKEIVELRKKVQENAMMGIRHEDLKGMIETSYGVSKSKAKFLARQETKLMLAKFKETQYHSVGVTKYIWCCVTGTSEHPVRDSHRALEGKTFSFDNPPVTDSKGNRNNPGEDYFCRCYGKPIVEFE